MAQLPNLAAPTFLLNLNLSAKPLSCRTLTGLRLDKRSKAALCLGMQVTSL